jgi:hypothetical protein
MSGRATAIIVELSGAKMIPSATKSVTRLSRSLTGIFDADALKELFSLTAVCSPGSA